MQDILAKMKQSFPGAKLWHIHGKFREFSLDRVTFSVKRFYVITANNEDFLCFIAKFSRSTPVTFGGITLSRYTSLIESQLAKKMLPSKDWKILVTALPKETNQRLMIIRKVQDGTEFLDLVRETRVIHQKFLTSVKKLVADIAQNL